MYCKKSDSLIWKQLQRFLWFSNLYWKLICNFVLWLPLYIHLPLLKPDSSGTPKPRLPFKDWRIISLLQLCWLPPGPHCQFVVEGGHCLGCSITERLIEGRLHPCAYLSKKLFQANRIMILELVAACSQGGLERLGSLAIGGWATIFGMD